jgi:hypothetical protein
LCAAHDHTHDHGHDHAHDGDGCCGDHGKKDVTVSDCSSDEDDHGHSHSHAHAPEKKKKKERKAVENPYAGIEDESKGMKMGPLIMLIFMFSRYGPRATTAPPPPPSPPNAYYAQQ